MFDVRPSNVMFLILQKIFQSNTLLLSQNFKTQDCQCYGIKQIKCIFHQRTRGEHFFETTRDICKTNISIDWYYADHAQTIILMEATGAYGLTLFAKRNIVTCYTRDNVLISFILVWVVPCYRFLTGEFRTV